MTRPLRVFLCHASQDKPAVRRLHRYLKQHSVQPWLDELDLLPGENWEVEIPNAIFSSDVILVCLSKNSVDKEGYVQKEITFALDKAQEKPEGTIFIIPIKLESCDVPKRLNRYQWVDLFRPDGYKRLLMGLNKRAIGLGSDVTRVLMPDETRPKPAPESVSKQPEIKKIDLQKAGQEVREKAERAAVEKAAREKFELEAIEKTKRERAEREAAEIAARVKAEREAKEKAEREAAEQLVRKEAAKEANAEREAGKKKEREQKPVPVAEEKKAREKRPALRINSRVLGIGGLLLAGLVCLLFGGNYLINNLPISASQATSTLEPPISTQDLPTYTLEPPTIVPTPTLGVGSTEISSKDGMTLLYVPAGEFLMGSDNAASNERPVRHVYLDAFWIDKTDITRVLC